MSQSSEGASQQPAASASARPLQGWLLVLEEAPPPEPQMRARPGHHLHLILVTRGGGAGQAGPAC